MLYLGVPRRSGPRAQVHPGFRASRAGSGLSLPRNPACLLHTWPGGEQGSLGMGSDPDSEAGRRGAGCLAFSPSPHLFPLPGAHPQGVPRLILQPLEFLPQTHLLRAAPRAHLLLGSSQGVNPTQLWGRGGEARGAGEVFLGILRCPRGLHI